jgi:hypothetical protein
VAVTVTWRPVMMASSECVISRPEYSTGPYATQGVTAVIVRKRAVRLEPEHEPNPTSTATDDGTHAKGSERALPWDSKEHETVGISELTETFKQGEAYGKQDETCDKRIDHLAYDQRTEAYDKRTTAYDKRTEAYDKRTGVRYTQRAETFDGRDNGSRGRESNDGKSITVPLELLHELAGYGTVASPKLQMLRYTGDVLPVPSRTSPSSWTRLSLARSHSSAATSTLTPSPATHAQSEGQTTHAQRDAPVTHAQSEVPVARLGSGQLPVAGVGGNPMGNPLRRSTTSVALRHRMMRWEQ